MGLFSIKRKNQPVNSGPSSADIPMLEKSIAPQPINEPTPIPETPLLGIDAIYAFLQADYETKGYNDALTNPDESYKNDNIQLFQFDLQILVQRSFTYYDDKIKEIDFHIGSRTRAGLIDLVEELKIKRELVLEHIGKVKQLQHETENNAGMSDRIRLSYQRGFMRGLAAISQTKVMNITL
jgi:hypothetical protein